MKVKKNKRENYNGWTGKNIPIAKRADRFTAIQERKDPKVKGHSWLAFWGYMAGYKAALRSKTK